MLTKGAMAVSKPPPNNSIHRKSAERPRKEPEANWVYIHDYYRSVGVARYSSIAGGGVGGVGLNTRLAAPETGGKGIGDGVGGIGLGWVGLGWVGRNGSRGRSLSRVRMTEDRWGGGWEWPLAEG